MKIIKTITLDAEIVEAHRKLGSNVSGICNEALKAALKGETILEEKKAEIQTVIDVVQKAKERAEKQGLLEKLLEKARKMRTIDTNGLKNALDEAEKVSGLPRAELVRKL